MSAEIIDRGRGSEIAGRRITVYRPLHRVDPRDTCSIAGVMDPGQERGALCLRLIEESSVTLAQRWRLLYNTGQ